MVALSQGYRLDNAIGGGTKQQFFVLIRPKKYSQNFNEIFIMGYNLGRGHNFQKF